MNTIIHYVSKSLVSFLIIKRSDLSGHSSSSPSPLDDQGEGHVRLVGREVLLGGRKRRGGQRKENFHQSGQCICCMKSEIFYYKNITGKKIC